MISFLFLHDFLRQTRIDSYICIRNDTDCWNAACEPCTSPVAYRELRHCTRSHFSNENFDGTPNLYQLDTDQKEPTGNRSLIETPLCNTFDSRRRLLSGA